MSRLFLLIAALVVALVSVSALESQRAGLEITDQRVGTTPVTRFLRPDTQAPAVVIAHGFAGSRQMMQGYALTLAQAGYRVYSFDFQGHGRNPVPMSGDVTSVDGTTRLLIEQTKTVIGHARAETGTSDAIALLGHSMATDVLIRTALQTPGSEPVVAISPFSQAVTPDGPDRLLMISGAWEPHLRDFSLGAVRQLAPDAAEGETVTVNGITRRAAVAPYAEHVSILYSRAARAEALTWLNRTYDRSATVPVPHSGWWFVALMSSIVAAYMAAVPMVLRAGPVRLHQPTAPVFWAAAIAPAAIAPVIATRIDIGFLPVLVADYLALHLLIMGGLQLVILSVSRARFGPVSLLGGGVLLLWALGAFGLALDRYGASFIPIPERLWIIAVLAFGTVPFMLADTRLSHDASRGRRLVLRAAFLGSLALAVALDTERLFFLLIIAPVIVLFYLVFGVTGHATAQRAGPLAPGIALGLVLAWSLGVSFPLFAAAG